MLKISYRIRTRRKVFHEKKYLQNVVSKIVIGLKVLHQELLQDMKAVFWAFIDRKSLKAIKFLEAIHFRK